MQKQIISALSTILMIVIFAAPLFSITTPAHAKLKICNETGETRDVAIGYKNSDGWISEGWWGLVDGDCTTVIKDDLTNLFYYYRAKHKGGDFDGDKYNFCTESRAFTIIGDQDCQTRGFKTEDFRQLELAQGTTGFTLTLNDTTIYSAGRNFVNKQEETTTPSNTPKANPASGPTSEPASRGEAENAAQSTGPGAPIGTYGEPYSIRAELDGCEYVDRIIMCTFLADGWKYVVKNDGKSYPRILNRLDILPLGGMYDITGDMIFYSRDTAEITIREYAPVQAVSQGAVPGTFGEPYNVTAIFKGCELTNAQMQCKFLTDDQRYVAFNDGKTRDDLLKQLAKLPLNKSYQIEGDVMNYGDITAEVTIRKLSPVKETGIEEYLNPLIGLWRSMEDQSYTIRFTSDFKKYDYTNGDISVESSFGFTKECGDPTVLRAGATLLQVNGPYGNDDVLCYDIVTNTEEALTLMFLPRGNFLEFKKVRGPNQ